MTAVKERNEAGTDIITAMEKFLASDYVLYVKTQNYHWNVTGPTFPALHEMFEKQYQQLLMEIDETAERIRTMGSFVPASLESFKKLSSVEDVATGKLSSAQMVQDLVKGHEKLIEEGEKLADLLEEAEDMTTNDFIIECVEKHQKTAWMLKSTL